jgi:DNA recombination protein RmuC|tara:strand:- start:2507 stop:3487 length:981 start_codon:yes stop_codon:yes gene_type:complete
MENTLLYILIIGVLAVTGFGVYLILQLQNKLKEQDNDKDKLDIERAVRDEISKSKDHTKESIDKIQQRLTIIDAAQKNIEELKIKVSDLSGNLVDFKNIFDNKQTRGSYGDKWLEEVVKDAIPKRFYKFQETLSNGKRVDCLLDFGTKGTAVAIDAKFPMPKKLLNGGRESSEDKVLEREFSTAITKHYNDISEKYIIENETANIALMFVPSHAVFDYINASSQNFMDKAREKGVQICSPTTLWITLKSYKLFAEGYIMNENSNLIRKEMVLVIKDVSRLSERIDFIENKHNEISNKFKEVKTSVDKIKNKSIRLENLDVEKKVTD